MKYEVKKDKIIDNILEEGNSYIKKIEDKIKDELNNFCVECGEENPEYISINNGIFLCRDCVQNHLKFPNGISKIKKNNIKSLTLNEIQYLLSGGNRALLNFIYKEYPKLAELSPNIFYKTQAMIYYRQYLQNSINGSSPPIKPSPRIAYKVSNSFNGINSNKNFKYNNIKDLMLKNEIKTNNMIIGGNEKLYKHKSKLYKNTDYNLRQSRNNQHPSNYIYTNSNVCSQKNNKVTIDYNNTIGYKSINYGNYLMNKLKKTRNKSNIINRKQSKNINNIEKDDKNNNFLPFPQKIKINLNSRNISKNNIDNINNENNGNVINTDIYIKPKLILSHNASHSYLINNKILEKRANSYDILRRPYYFFQNNNYLGESNIDTIPLKILEDFNNNIRLRKMNKYLSHEINKKNNATYIKKINNIHKSFSHKILNINNKNENIENNKCTIISQTENNQNIPSKIATINYNNYYKNKMSISNIEEFQILARNTLNNSNINKIHTIINTNTIINGEKSSTVENISFNEYNTLPIKINIKVNRKKKAEIKERNNKKEKTQENKEKENICLNQNYFEIKKKESLNNFLQKSNKNKVIIEEKEKEEKKSNKINNKGKENQNILNNGVNVKRRTFSKDNNIFFNQNKMNDNKNKNEKKKFSIRNKYKMKIKNK